MSISLVSRRRRIDHRLQKIGPRVGTMVICMLALQRRNRARSIVKAIDGLEWGGTRNRT